jgi:hypothetical protein
MDAEALSLLVAPMLTGRSFRRCITRAVATGGMEVDAATTLIGRASSQVVLFVLVNTRERDKE